MPRLTVTITDEQSERLEELSGDDGEYESKSEAVRNFIEEYEDHQERIEELEQTVERLQNEKQTLVEQHQQTKELVEYREAEDFFANASFGQRIKWLFTGKTKQPTAEN